NCGARDLLALANSLAAGLRVSRWLREPPQVLLDFAHGLTEKILAVITGDPPLGVKDGGMIRRGVHDTLDEYLTLSQDSQQLLLELEAREREATGIGSLKVRYNNVFGYYIEITKTHAAKAPASYY